MMTSTEHNEVPEPSDLEIAVALRNVGAGIRHAAAGDLEKGFAVVLRGKPIPSIHALLTLSAMFLRHAKSEEETQAFLADFILEQQEKIRALEAEEDKTDG